MSISLRSARHFCTVFVAFAGAVLFISPVLASDKKHAPDPNAPDGRFLNGVYWEGDEDKKVALLEQFEKLFPHSDSVGIAYARLQELYIKRKQLDKAIEMGDKLLALDPDDVETARQNQQLAAAKGDQALVKKYSDMTAAIAKRLASQPTPIDPASAGDNGRRVELAKELISEREYELYDQAYKAADPHQKIAALDQLLAQFPQSKYLKDAHVLYYVCYRQLNQAAKAMVEADWLMAQGERRPDILLFAADYNFRTRKDGRKAAAYCEEVVGDIESGKKPEGVDDAEWARQKGQLLNQAQVLEFWSYKETKDAPKAAAAAEVLAARGQAQPDVLLYAADYYFRVQRDPQKVTSLCEQVMRAVGTLHKPAGMSEADWLRQNDLYTEMASYMIGSLQAESGRFAAADETLRQALPIARRTQYMVAAITSSLAWTSFQLQKFGEAAALYKQCLDFGGTYRETAVKYLAKLKNEHGIQ